MDVGVDEWREERDQETLNSLTAVAIDLALDLILNSQICFHETYFHQTKVHIYSMKKRAMVEKIDDMMQA